MASAGGGGGRRRRGCGGRRVALQQPHLVARQRPAQVRHRPARREHDRLARLRAHEHELALAEAADRRVERRQVGPAGRRLEPVQHARLVVVGLQPPDHPGARVRHRLVVEVDRVLRREHHPDAERARLLEDREDRLLGRRRGGRRHEAEHLVHVDERAQVGRAGLRAHPGDQLREHERDHELALVLGQVREVHDRGARAAVGGPQQRADVERRALPPGRERGRGDQPVEAQRQRGALLRREERVDVEDAELAAAAAPGSRRSASPGRGPAPPATRARSGSRAARTRGWPAGRPAMPISPSRLVTVPSISSRSVSDSVSHDSGGACSEPTTLSGTPAFEPGV